MMEMTGWIVGLPVRVGWYNASSERNENCRRYWHGTYWSAPCYVYDPERIKLRAKNTVGESQTGIDFRGLPTRAGA